MKSDHRIAVVIPAFNEEKSLPQTLEALARQTRVPESIIVVDNASTDGTGALVESFAKRFPYIHLVHEGRKGTGYACVCGFEYALSVIGATLILRTDADTVTEPQWVEVAARKFSERPLLMLLGGKQMPLHDASYRWYDSVLWPVYEAISRGGAALVYLNPMWFKLAIGCNMAVRSSAYREVGGFLGGHIGAHDEDRTFNEAIYARYGWRGLGYSIRFAVRFSMRRIRKTGYVGLWRYYYKADEEHRKDILKGEIDIR